MIYFLSDVHLGIYKRETDKEREEFFLSFINKIKNDCEHLFIVGDLFDYWFEYKYVIPKYFYRTITALYDLRASGTKIDYLMGNHDFGHRNFFSEELDIAVHKGDIQPIIQEKKFYISHGDGKIKNDYAYNFVKKIFRHKLSLWLYLKLHPDWGIGLASHSSKESRKYSDKKRFGTEDSLETFAKEKIDAGFDFVIMGHRHLLKLTQYKNGVYCNLGEWFKSPHFAVFDGNTLSLKDVKQYINK
mgnify:CR=1 FL=1